jgi:hypothetical protein
MKESFKNKKLFLAALFACIILCGLTMAYWLWEAGEDAKESLDVEFAGPVERVDYDIKQFPTIMIANKSYYIGSGYNTDHQIEVGDSVIKKKGAYVYKLIKHGSNKTIEFDR